MQTQTTNKNLILNTIHLFKSEGVFYLFIIAILITKIFLKLFAFYKGVTSPIMGIAIW